ncbi:uncharacterized protein LOC114306043 [Camellia sinensis]|uniref:uncharacterized protein LOC114306043 n=1 Tax=Camellia sinensis TaxID=4442 RepID=UPI001035C25C|nr:uncharacterized protein LOC114306043 [Camellia sinensis]
MSFSMKSYFLGISIQTTPTGYVLSQKKYTQDILNKAGLADCKPCPSPISIKPSIALDSATLCPDPALYRSLVGALQYLTITHPNISLAVNHSCQHMHSPTVGHFAEVKRLLHFVKGTIRHCLTYSPNSFDIHAYSDSNWAGDVSDRKSTSGYCIFLGSNLVSWSAKKRATVSRSSTKAEYKHIEVDCHFVHDQVLAKRLVLRYIPTIDWLTSSPNLSLSPDSCISKTSSWSALTPLA